MPLYEVGSNVKFNLSRKLACNKCGHKVNSHEYFWKNCFVINCLVCNKLCDDYDFIVISDDFVWDMIYDGENDEEKTL